MEIYADAAQLLGERKPGRLTQNVTLHQQYQLEDLAKANHWELPEALHIGLANGLALLEAVKIARKQLEEGPAGEAPEEEPRLIGANRWQELAHRLDTRYATLKFMAFRLTQNNQTLKFNLSGLTNGLAMARGTTRYLQKERQRLEQLNRLLRQEHCVITPAQRAIPPLAPTSPTPPKTVESHDLSQNQTDPKITYFPGGAACYELNVIDELAEAAISQKAAQESDRADLLLEGGLLVLTALTNTETGDLPLSVLEQVGHEIGGPASVKNASNEKLDQMLEALDHFLSARSTTLVMEAQVASLKGEGEQLEETVQGLREQDWAWHEWSTSMRDYLARLELENRHLKEPEQVERSQPETPKFSFIKWFKEKLLAG